MAPVAEVMVGQQILEEQAVMEHPIMRVIFPVCQLQAALPHRQGRAVPGVPSVRHTGPTTAQTLTSDRVVPEAEAVEKVQ